MNDDLHNPAAAEFQQTPIDTQAEGESSAQAKPASHEVPVEETLHIAGDDVRKAAEAVCRTFQERAAEQVKRLRETSMGDLVDGALNLVKKYPGPGVILAVLLGFLLGRSLKK
jgi:hypothetical protein